MLITAPTIISTDMDTVVITVGAAEFTIKSPDARKILSGMFRNRNDMICRNTEYGLVYYIAGVRFCILPRTD